MLQTKIKFLYVSPNFSLDITLTISFQINTKYILPKQNKVHWKDTLQADIIMCSGHDCTQCNQ